MFHSTNICSFLTELKHEIEVWKKACHSISGYSRDENSVRLILKKKVMALEGQLRKHIYDSTPSDDDYRANLKELENKVKIWIFLFIYLFIYLIIYNFLV